MRRFSQRSHLVTLSEINITPLLDLAFVLLIIFVITTPLLDKGFNLKLPTADAIAEKPPDRRDINTVEITSKGEYMLNRARMNLNEVEKNLIATYKANPNMVVYIRADENGKNKDTYAIIERCQKNGITRFSLRTEPPGNR
jgi:biopolymer transport protein ExbD